MKSIELPWRALSPAESRAIVGGNPFWIGVAVGLAARGVYDLLNGIYAGILSELEKPDTNWSTQAIQ